MPVLNEIVGRTLLGVGGMSDGFLERLTQVVTEARKQFLPPAEITAIARNAIAEFEPLLAEHLADSAISAWIYGFDDVSKQFPHWLQKEFADSIRRRPPDEPPAFNLFGMFGGNNRLRLPIIENAAKRLMERNILTREEYDAAADEAKAQAFTIAGDLNAQTIDRLRFFLTQDLYEGTSFSGFKDRVAEHLGTSPIAPGHLENVYRTNIQAAIRDGRETLRQNPIVAATFPYREYIPTHDARTRHEHLELGHLGLNGTGIYRSDDPFWDHFTPPWGYQCRCNTRLLTIDQAAAAGVKEAQEWLRTGRAPLQPEFRYALIPFPANPGWGERGAVGVIAMALGPKHAPRGYTHDDPLVINGKEYVGGNFIPATELKHATKDQLKEIKTGKKSAQLGFSFDEPAKEPTQRKSAEVNIPKAPKPKGKTNEGNWRYENRNFFSAGLKKKFRDNMEAIHTLKSLESEKRPATKDEQEKLSKFVGWGQFPSLFDYKLGHKEYRNWDSEREEMQALIGDDEFESARKATPNSHFTHPDVIDAHWDMAKRLGFKGGKLLEPAVGAGYYLGLMPPEIAAKTHVTAVEMDKLSGGITKALYPAANVKVAPFQDTRTPDNFYDMTATNVPFAEKILIHDPKYKFRPNLHDYYFMRSVDTTKPGGLIMNLTSAGTMDKLSPRVRKYLEEHTELVSAIRFPGDTHKDNAGTSVVTDMLILRKKHPAIPPVTDETPSDAQPAEHGFTGTTIDSLGRLYHWQNGIRIPAPSWMDTVNVPDPAGGEPIPVNRYFADHPEQILGTLDRTGTMYHGESMNVSRTDDYDKLLDKAIARLPENASWTHHAAKAADEPAERIEADKRYNEGQIVVQDGKAFRNINGALESLDVNAEELARITGQVEIRDKARALMAAQRAGQGIVEARADLNAAYDDYTSQFGNLHDKANRSVMKDDPDAAFLRSLEHYNSKAKTATKADIFSKVTVVADKRATSASGVSEATGIVLHETGKMDVDRIAALTGKPLEEVHDELVAKGLAYNDPSRGWTHASEYLSGNTRKKLIEAEAAAASDPSFQPNVEALKRSQPDDIPYDQIGIKLGAPWVPTATISQFAAETLGVDPKDFKVSYIPETGEWHIDTTWRAETSPVYRRSWSVDGGEDKVNFGAVMNAALHSKSITCRKDIKNAHGDTIRIVNQEATEAANEKVAELKAQFKEWVWADPARREELTNFYNAHQNDLVDTHFDGSHLTFPGMSEAMVAKIYPSQKNFIWRVITTGKGLGAHEVGTGKTNSMIAAAMELRRLGLAKKPAIVVKKANIEQITASILKLYPDAKVLSTADSFTADKRQYTLNQIATGDYDIVLLTHDHLDLMQLKPENNAKFIQDQISEMADAVLTAKAASIRAGDSKESTRIVKDLEKRKMALEQNLKAAMSQENKDDIYFEDTGIDQLFVDEAHRFKTLPVTTIKGNVKGVPKSTAKMAVNMLARSRWLQENNGGRGVVFMTGTPIANTMAEMYNMQRYLQYDAMRERGLHRFDTWADTYGDIAHNYEFKLSGEVKATPRFSEFVNLPELRHFAADFMDVQRADDLKHPDGSPIIKRPNKIDEVVAIPVNDGIAGMMRGINARAEALKGKRPEKGEDSMLSVCHDARQGSIDLRLLDPEAPDHPDSKANTMVRKVLELYHAHPGKTQAIFSEIGVHPNKETGFHLFGDIRNKLIAGGIPADEIVDFSDSKTEGERREAAQDGMKRGTVRIALGSTERLGTGTNVQTHLIAAHHLDVPWVPAQIEQRDGRGFRKGNLNKDFHTYKYVQQGSADHIFWQIVGTKAHFINQYMLGKGNRTMTELSSDELTPDEMMAVATGDETMMERIGLKDETRRLRNAKQRHEQSRLTSQQMLDQAPAEFERKLDEKRAFESDARHLASRPEFEMEVKYGDVHDRHTERPRANEALESAAKFHDLTPWDRRPEKRPLGTYKGMPMHLDKFGRLVVTGPSGQTYHASPSVASLEYKMREIATIPPKIQAEIDARRVDLEKIKSTMHAPFRHEEELKAKSRRLEELELGRKRMSLFREEDHPRGQPENKGEFVEKNVERHEIASEALKGRWFKRKFFWNATFDAGEKSEVIDGVRVTTENPIPITAELIRADTEYLSELDDNDKEKQILNGINQITGEAPFEFVFRNIRTEFGDEKNAFGMTGTGHGTEIIRKTADIMLGALANRNIRPKVITYTAQGKSRASLYRFLTERVAKKSHGYFVGMQINLPGYDGAFAIVESESVEKIERLASRLGVGISRLGRKRG